MRRFLSKTSKWSSHCSSIHIWSTKVLGSRFRQVQLSASDSRIPSWARKRELNLASRYTSYRRTRHIAQNLHFACVETASHGLATLFRMIGEWGWRATASQECLPCVTTVFTTWLSGRQRSETSS